MAGSKAVFDYTDALNLEGRLTDDEKMVRDVFHDYCQVISKQFILKDIDTLDILVGMDMLNLDIEQSNTLRYSINVLGRPQISTGIWRAVQYKEGGELSIDHPCVPTFSGIFNFFTADWLISAVNKE